MHAGGRGAAATQVFILHLLLLHVGSIRRLSFA